MSYQEGNSGQHQRRGITHMQKRQILWNIIEPGDPYDIKKSMIAKLPGDRKTFMGAHIQMVCLLQAAQIQRLCQYLEQYKLRYRQIQRRQLDRHSYQIQIKELSQKISDQTTFSAQNLKLRQFLRKQSSQLEQLRKLNNSYDQALKKKYDGALIQIQSMTRQINILKTQRQNLHRDIDQYLAKIAAMQTAKKRQIQDLKYTLSDNTKIVIQKQRRQFLMKFQSQINKLQFDNRRLKQINDHKNKQLQQLQIKNKQLYFQIQQQISKNQQYSQLQIKLKQYQNRFHLVGQQIQRLNLVLRDKTGQLNQMYTKYRQLQIQYHRKDIFIQQLQNRIKHFQYQYNQYQIKIKQYKYQLTHLNQNKKIIQNYQNRLQMLSKQIQRLNQVLKKKLQQNNGLLQKLRTYQYQINNINLVMKQNQQLKKNLYQIGQMRKKLAQYQNKISMLALQIQRLNNLLKRQKDQSIINQKRIKSQILQIQQYRKKIQQLQNSFSYQWQTKVNIYQQKLNTYHQENDQLRRRLRQTLQNSRKISQYQSRLTLLSQEIQRLNQTLRVKVDESKHHQQRNHNLQHQIEGYRRKVGQMQSSITYEWQSKITIYEQKISGFIQENQELRKRIKQLSDVNRKIAEHQNKIALLSQQIERLNGNLRSKVEQSNSYEQRVRLLQQELDGARRKISEMQASISQQWKNKVAIYQQKITTFTQQNDQLRRRLKQLSQVHRKIAEYENKIVLLSQQVDRLNGLLDRYSKDNSSLSQKVAEIEHLRSTIASMQQKLNKSSIDQRSLSDQFRAVQENYRLSTIQNNQLVGRLNQILAENDELKRRLTDFGQINRKVTEYENRIALLSQQIERLNIALKSKVQQLNLAEKRNQSLQQQLEGSRRRILEMQSSISTQWKTKVTIYEQKITAFTQENNELRLRLKEAMETNRKIGEYENRITQLLQEIERLNANLKGKVEQINSYEQRYRSLQQQLENYRRKMGQMEHSIIHQWQSKVTIYEQKITAFTQQNEDLRRKLREFLDTNKRLAEYQNRIALLSQEIDRLNIALKSKTEQINISEQRNRAIQQELQGARRRINEMQLSVTHQWKAKVTLYEQQMTNITKDNEDLRRKVKELLEANRKLGEYQNRLTQFSQQVQRLNSTLKIKIEQLNSSEQRNHNFQHQIEGYRRKVGQMQSSITYEWQSKITIYEQKISGFIQENQELRKRIKQLSDVNRKIAEHQNKIALLSQQIERLNGNLRSKVEQSNSYEQRVRLLQQELDGARRKISEMQASISQQWKNKVAIYQQKITTFTQQNDQLRRRLKQLSQVHRKIAEYENKIVLLSQQVDRLNGLLDRYSKDNSSLSQKVAEIEHLRSTIASMQQKLNKSSIDQRSLSDQFRAVQENYRLSTIQNNQLVGRLNQILAENDELKRRLTDFGQINRKVTEYENRIALLSQQIERLNIALKSKVQQLNLAEKRNQSLQQQLEGSRRRILEMQSSISTQWKTKVTIYEQKITAFTQENNELRLRLKEAMETNRKIGEYENRITQLLQEIERLNANLKGKVEQINSYEQRYRSLQQQLENYRRKMGQMEHSIIHQWQSKVTIYEQKITAFTQQNEDLRRKLREFLDTNKRLAEYQNRIALLSQEIDRLNIALKSKTEQINISEQRNRAIQQELQGARRRINEMQLSVTHQWKAKVTLYEQQMTNITKDNEDLRRKVKELLEANRKLGEYQNRLTQFSQQVQRLNSTLKIKIEQLNSSEQRNHNFQHQIEGYRRKVGQMQSSITYEWQSKITIYEQKISGFIQENQELRKRIKQLSDVNRKIAEHQNKIALLSQQIERLNGNLRSKVEQSNSYEQRVRLLQQELDGARRKISEMQASISQQWKNKVAIYQQKITTFTQQNDQLRRRLKQLVQKNRQIPLYQSKVVDLGHQIQRLNLILKTKIEQLSSWQSRSRSLQQQLESSRKRFQDSQNSTYMFQSKISTYQQKFQSYNQQIQDYRKKLKDQNQFMRKISQYQNKISILSQQIQRLNITLKSKIQQINNYDKKLRLISQQLDISKRKINQIGQYQFRLTKLSQQIQRLNLVLKQYSQKNYTLVSQIDVFRRKQLQYISDIQRLNNTLRLKVQQSSRWQSSVDQLVSKCQQYQSRQNYKQSQYQKLHSAYNMILTQYQNSKKHIVQYQQSIKKLYTQFQRLQSIMQQLKKQNYNLKVQIQKSQGIFQKNRVLSAQIDRLNQIIQQLKQQISQIRLRLCDDVALQKRINQHMALMVVLFAQIQSLRKRVKDKQKQVQDVRRSSLAPFKV